MSLAEKYHQIQFGDFLIKNGVQLVSNMQIVCNNCGKRLRVPMQDSVIPCPHCNTILEVKVNDENITSTIFSTPKTDDSQSLILGRTLLGIRNLELEYTFHLQEKQFRTLLLNEWLRPVLIYATIKRLFGVLIGTICLNNLFSVENNFLFIIRFIGIIAGVILIILAIKEKLRWILMGRFEQSYIDKKSKLIETLEILDLPESFQRQIRIYKENHEVYWRTQKSRFNYGINQFIYGLKPDNIQFISFIFTVLIFLGTIMLIQQNHIIAVVVSYFIVISSLIVGFRIYQKRIDTRLTFDKYQQQIQGFLEDINNHLE